MGPMGEIVHDALSTMGPSAALGRAEHALVEDLGSEVYATAVSHGWIEEADPQFAAGTPRHAVRRLLTELGLLRHDEDARRYIPVDPSTANDQVVVPLAQRGSELLAVSARWNDVFARLGQVYRTSPLHERQATEEIHGLPAINSFIDGQLRDCRSEFLSAQPAGRRPPAVLAEAEPRDVALLRRGVAMRTLYQHSARQSAPTREYVAEVTALGAEVRTSDEFFKRLLIFDRHTALIPAADARAVAVVVRDKSVVMFLVDIFERAWERAMPFTITGLAVARAIAEEVRAMTLRMLVDGHSDATSAKRMGVSPRTYASYIAALKEEYGVQTRFQLGWAMSKTHRADHRPGERAGESPGLQSF
jgi:hypothetical protein